ncbi:MAG: oligosaccharide flippase family protein [Acidobacteria bacterium]|nr:oligosaccharide flippase family protein [Acidobacteriota bacterium]
MPAVGEAVVCWKSAGPLLRFGGWITVSNLLSPLMVSLDRFLIAALLSVAAVAFYATPYELVTRLQLLPASVAGALFPALSEWLGRDAVEARRLYRRALAWVFLLLGPAALLAMGLARPALDFWLGAEFAARSTGVVRILAAGVWINALAYLPSAWLQAAGRPDLTAKLHLLELPLYLAAAWWLIETRGIEGAAWAWTLRVTLDAGLLFWLAGRGRTEPHATGWEIADAAGTRVSF